MRYATTLTTLCLVIALGACSGPGESERLNVTEPGEVLVCVDRWSLLPPGHTDAGFTGGLKSPNSWTPIKVYTTPHQWEIAGRGLYVMTLEANDPVGEICLWTVHPDAGCGMVDPSNCGASVSTRFYL